jgi:anti-sigma B factor antagonist
MRIDWRIVDGTMVLIPPGARIDAAIAVAFKQAVRDALADHAGPVVMDMRGVEFVDSSGLGALVGVLKLRGAAGLGLAGCQPPVMRVLTLTHMDSVFALFDAPPETGRVTDVA